jgi:hypothetical protein
LYDWQKLSQIGSNYNRTKLPEGAEDYLHIENPRLIELEKRYSNFDKNVTTTLVWQNKHLRPEDILYFRGDNAYVWQLRGPNMNTTAYALTTLYIKSIDNLGLLDKLQEDELFGLYAFNVDKKLISRDLLDSINEIYFLNRHLNISSSDKNINILDIGAGYGRLAHRLLTAFPNHINYYCTDAVAVSTFISEYYMRFRRLDNRAKIIPLDKIENELDRKTIDIAINIHSFSECKIEAIEWWLSLLERCRVNYLLIVPNTMDHGGELLLTNERKNIQDVVVNHGYELVVKEPKYSEAVAQKFAINPTYYYLFKLH